MKPIQQFIVFLSYIGAIKLNDYRHLSLSTCTVALYCTYSTYVRPYSLILHFRGSWTKILKSISFLVLGRSTFQIVMSHILVIPTGLSNHIHCNQLKSIWFCCVEAVDNMLNWWGQPIFQTYFRSIDITWRDSNISFSVECFLGENW